MHTFAVQDERAQDSIDDVRLRATKLVESLSAAERELLELMVDGSSLIQISGRLGLTLEEAVRLKASVMKKVGATQTADLVRIGVLAASAPDLAS